MEDQQTNKSTTKVILRVIVGVLVIVLLSFLLIRVLARINESNEPKTTQNNTASTQQQAKDDESAKDSNEVPENPGAQKDDSENESEEKTGATQTKLPATGMGENIVVATLVIGFGTFALSKFILRKNES